MRIKSEVAKMKDVDIYSIMMFTLYKMMGIPEYSTLSELAYILDKENLLKLCEYFGGTTIKIPTIDELEIVVYTMVLYQYVNIDGMAYDDAVKLIGHKSSDLRKVKGAYTKLCNVLKNYQIRGGDNA